jgi:beta-amylase
LYRYTTASFTFLRLTKELFEDDNFNSFVHFVGRMQNKTGVGVRSGERRKVVEADAVLDELLPAGNIMSLEDIRGETSSGFVAAQFSDL